VSRRDWVDIATLTLTTIAGAAAIVIVLGGWFR